RPCAPRGRAHRHAGVARTGVAGHPGRRRVGGRPGRRGRQPMTRPIEASALVRTFGDIRAVDGVDLAVEPSEIFAFLGPHRADRRVGTYSGGMRRRLDLALALVHEPEVLFLDEPTTGLDPMSRIALWEEVHALNADGTTVFLTTQYLEEADRLAGRIAIIDHG